MDSISQNIANNILRLRKLNNWTQNDLASKVNYSDKTISKWERGESVPDITTLCLLADLFKVNVDYLTKNHTDKEIESTLGNKQQLLIRNLLITIMLCIAVYLIATIVFVYTTINSPILASKYWISFIVAFPICCAIVTYYARATKRWIAALISMSLFVWGTLLTFFLLTSIIYNLSNSWMLFLIGVPIQAAIFIYYFWKFKI
ncbi:MAG TPA: helix-turn-helix transcriptional regulator [Erysipelotrichaceae bacterium]|nr:helix-turn-helix transcriptional regulator [Erysipelotrichaceae bacterium]